MTNSHPSTPSAISFSDRHLSSRVCRGDRIDRPSQPVFDGQIVSALVSSILRVVRSDTTTADAYDEHVAAVSIDGDRVGEIPLGGSQDFPVEAGQHDVGVRLGMNFGTRHVVADVPENGTTTVTCTKARSAKDPRSLVHPSHYWSLTIH